MHTYVSSIFVTPNHGILQNWKRVLHNIKKRKRGEQNINKGR
jgi:hypothetical protein